MANTKLKASSSKTTYAFTIEDLKQLFADELGVSKEQVVVSGVNSYEGWGMNGTLVFSGIDVTVESAK